MTTREIDVLLAQVRLELLRFVEANENGTITIHCGPSQYVVETNSKKQPIKRQAPKLIAAIS